MTFKSFNGGVIYLNIQYCHFFLILAGTAQQVFDWGAKLDEFFFFRRGGRKLGNFYLISKVTENAFITIKDY